MNYFWCFWCFIFTVSSLAQTKIKGQVIDFDNAVPIAFASITHNKSTINADWEGKFSLTIEDFKSPVKINYKGYHEKIVYASNTTTHVTIKLIHDIHP